MCSHPSFLLNIQVDSVEGLNREEEVVEGVVVVAVIEAVAVIEVVVVVEAVVEAQEAVRTPSSSHIGIKVFLLQKAKTTCW
jgi:hypothetical protein